MISHETVRKYIPPIHYNLMESSGYFVYEDQCIHIDGDGKLTLKGFKDRKLC